MKDLINLTGGVVSTGVRDWRKYSRMRPTAQTKSWERQGWLWQHGTSFSHIAVPGSGGGGVIIATIICDFPATVGSSPELKNTQLNWRIMKTEKQQLFLNIHTFATTSSTKPLPGMCRVNVMQGVSWYSLSRRTACSHCGELKSLTRGLSIPCGRPDKHFTSRALRYQSPTRRPYSEKQTINCSASPPVQRGG